MEPYDKETDIIREDRIGGSQDKEREKGPLIRYTDIQDSLVSWKQSREHFNSVSKVCETLHSTKTEKCPPDLAVWSFLMTWSRSVLLKPKPN